MCAQVFSFDELQPLWLDQKRRGVGFLVSHSFWWRGLLVCATVGDVHFGHLMKVVSARLLHCEASVRSVLWGVLVKPCLLLSNTQFLRLFTSV